MTEIIGVHFKNSKKLYYFNPNGLKVDVGQFVIVETSKGMECAECTKTNTMVDEMELVSALRPVVRLANEQDIATRDYYASLEQEAFAICAGKVQEHRLDMKLIDVQYCFDGSKIVFSFTAQGRIDFRGLVKDLAAIFHTRIEMRQIGVRDEARILGGLGICGRPFCCAQFLDDFVPVSIKMAKTQNISLNPTKISGACGRLMCCLHYEQDAYDDILQRMPKVGSKVKTPDGIGTIIQSNVLRELSKVSLDNEPDVPRFFKNSDIVVIGRSNKRIEVSEMPEQISVQEKMEQNKLLEQLEQAEHESETKKPEKNSKKRRDNKPKNNNKRRN